MRKGFEVASVFSTAQSICAVEKIVLIGRLLGTMEYLVLRHVKRNPQLLKSSVFFVGFSAFLSVLSKNRELFISVLSKKWCFFLSVLSKNAIFASENTN